MHKVFALIVAAWIGYALGHKTSSIVVMDLKRAILQPTRLLSQSKINESQQKDILQRYAQRLPNVIAEYGKQHHVTILSSPVLVDGGGVDITSIIMKQTLERVNHAA